MQGFEVIDLRPIFPAIAALEAKKGVSFGKVRLLTRNLLTVINELFGDPKARGSFVLESEILEAFGRRVFGEIHTGVLLCFVQVNVVKSHTGIGNIASRLVAGDGGGDP